MKVLDRNSKFEQTVTLPNMKGRGERWTRITRFVHSIFGNFGQQCLWNFAGNNYIHFLFNLQPGHTIRTTVA